MNKKGFTLVELIVVIAILGAIMILMTTNALGIFDKTKDKVNVMMENNVVEAAKLYAVSELNLKNCKICGDDENSSYYECVDDRNNCFRTPIEIDKLKDKGYLKDSDNKCSGSIKIYKFNGSYEAVYEEGGTGNGFSCEG